jgi:hypothetical protein
MVVAIVAIAFTRPWWEAMNLRPVLVSCSVIFCARSF